MWSYVNYSTYKILSKVRCSITTHRVVPSAGFEPATFSLEPSYTIHCATRAKEKATKKTALVAVIW